MHPKKEKKEATDGSDTDEEKGRKEGEKREKEREKTRSLILVGSQFTPPLLYYVYKVVDCSWWSCWRPHSVPSFCQHPFGTAKSNIVNSKPEPCLFIVECSFKSKIIFKKFKNKRNFSIIVYVRNKKSK